MSPSPLAVHCGLSGPTGRPTSGCIAGGAGATRSLCVLGALGHGRGPPRPRAPHPAASAVTPSLNRLRAPAALSSNPTQSSALSTSSAPSLTLAPSALSSASAATSSGTRAASTTAAGPTATTATAITAKGIAATTRVVAKSSSGVVTGRQRAGLIAPGAWHRGESPGGRMYGNGNDVWGGWGGGQRATGGAAAATAASTAAAAAALDGGGSVGPGSGGGGCAEEGESFLDRPTAEVRMSTVSERAAATCALGGEVAERMQADCIRAVRSWCKLGYGDHVVVHVEHQQLASSNAGSSPIPPGLLSSAAVTFTGPDGCRHAAIAVSVGVLAGGGGGGSPATSSPPPSQPPSPSRSSVNHQFGAADATAADAHSAIGGSLQQQQRRRLPATAHVAPGSSAPFLDPLPGLSLHWGCCYGLGQRWHAAAAGWHTLPGVSYDAGKGAWQTPLAVRQAIPVDLDSSGTGTNPGQWVAVYSLVLQLPWEGPIRNGGLCFVLKTARNQWIKARVLPPALMTAGSSGSGGGSGSSTGGETDFWIPTSALPVVANGSPRLPDVLRMSHSDSLPQVAVLQQELPSFSEPRAHGGGDGNGNGFDNGYNDHADAAASHSRRTPPLASPTTTTTTTTTAQLPSPLDSQHTPQQQQQQLQQHSPVAETQPPSPFPSSEEGGGLDLLAWAALFRAPPRLSDALLRPADRHPLPPSPQTGADSAPGRGSCRWMLDHIAQREPFAERSLMHRYNAGADLVEMAGGSGDVAAALAAVTAWIRLSSSRLLVWNRNYNVKPREICTAQSRLAAALAALGASRGPAAPGGRGSAAVGALVRVALAAVGRGGAGEVGQRIRDEILAIQQRNGCKGGMMEEWHQKLHNNTSPDDVIICKALLDYIAAGLDITAYWRTLSGGGITAQRLASFDRPITSEPRFSGQQAAGLQRDLTAYLQTLQAVHGGDDLASAINNVLGYGETDMKGKRIIVPPVQHVMSPTLEQLLRAILALQRHLASPAAAAAAAPAGAPPALGAGVIRTPPSTVAPGNTATTAATTSMAGGPAAAAHRPNDVASLYGLPGAVRLMEMVVEARHLIRTFLDGGDSACGGRLVDLAFLDLALDSTLRTAVETNIGPIKRTISEATAIYIASAAARTGNGNGAAATTPRPGGGGSIVGGGGGGAGGGRPPTGAFAASAALSQALEVMRLAAENAALSCCPNDDLVYSNKWLRLLVAQEDPRDARDRMLQALAIVERLKRFLADQGAALMGLIQPPAEALAERLKIQPAAVSGVGEEVIRGTSGAPLAQLLASLEPALRQATGGGAWQIVSRGSDRPVLAGRLRVEPRLAAVQHEIMRESTVLLVEGITGAEEIPEGCVAVLVGDGASGSGCPDVLSHSAVRARNMGVLLAGCHSAELVGRIKSHAGSRVMVRLEGADVQISFSSTGATGASAAPSADGAAAN